MFIGPEPERGRACGLPSGGVRAITHIYALLEGRIRKVKTTTFGAQCIMIHGLGHADRYAGRALPFPASALCQR